LDKKKWGNGTTWGTYAQELQDNGYIVLGTCDVYSNNCSIYLIRTAPDPMNIDQSEDNYISNFILHQNYPNPFNPSTSIEFTLPKSEFTTLKVFNILGKEVETLVSNNLNQGNHTYQFDGKNLASGVYYYQLVAGDFTVIKKMVLIK